MHYIQPTVEKLNKNSKKFLVNTV